MVERNTRRLAATLLGASLLIAGPVAAQPDRAALAASLQPGQIKVQRKPWPNSSVAMGHSVAVVAAPHARVVQILENYGQYVKFMPHFRASRVLSQRGSSALVYMEAEAAHGAITLWVQMKLKAKSLPDKTRVITATMVKGNVAAMHASWSATPIDATHTLVSFEIMMDPDLPLPSSLISAENEKAARKSLKALRALAQKAPSAAL